MKMNQELQKFLSRNHGIPEESLNKYSSTQPQALQIKDTNLYLDGIIVDSATEKMYKAFGVELNFITPENVREALGKFNNDITMWINSPGGSVFDASSILTAMMRFQEDYKINVVVDGVAASAATYLAVHGDNRKIAKMAMFMIHNSWAFAVGDGDALHNVADSLDKIDGTYAEMMADKSDMDADEIRQAMKKETWYSASEAVDAGFMDQVYEPKNKKSPEPKQTTAQRFTATVHALNEIRGF